MKQLEDLRPDLFFPDTWTEEERLKVADVVSKDRVKTNMFTSIPMMCRAEKCHPAGTMIKTSHGYKAIESLRPGEDLLVSWDRNADAIRGGWPNGNIKGFSFTLHSRNYSGNMFTVQSDVAEYACTHDHHVVVRWNEKARNENLFCVYLMRKGNYWRVGKTKLFTSEGVFGPKQRAATEKADCFWVLGVYPSNTEALLAEEWFSCTHGIPKACFVTSIAHKNSKWDGIYKWVTQEQLDTHFKSLIKDELFYAQMLDGLGLCIDHPFVELSGRKGVTFLEISACNIISGLMDVPSEQVTRRNREWQPTWVTVTSTYKTVSDVTVYSLNVEKHHTYIANGLVSHNCPYAATCPLQQQGIAPKNSKCPIELAMVQQFFEDYVEELGVDTTRMVEVSMVRDLVDQEVQHMRKVNLLANEHFIQENVVGIDGNGKPIMQKQMHLAVELEDRIHKRKDKLRSQLLATRESKARAGQSKINTAQVVADLLEQAQELDHVREALLSKKLSNVMYDDYIDVHAEDEGEE